MSYLVLARKSRPQSFAEVVGQQAVVKTLKNSIARGRIAHAILFSGVRGVGKTTLARIMAKAINCQAQGEKPCNSCQPCEDITAGRFLDLTEIDGASNRGIEQIRELKENLKFMPAHSAYKVIIIDEVHMLTTEAFNALLKPHVYFMFATTEIHKIPVTILSRCQQFELKKIPAEELAAHFSKLAENEGITIEPAALSLIVREAAGSIRDGLSLLDQMFSYGEERVSEDDVVEVLGLIGRHTLMQIATALLGGDRAQLLSCLDKVFAHGISPRRFMDELMETFRNLLLSSIRKGEKLVDLPSEELADLQAIAAETTTETLHLQLSLLMDAAEKLQHSPQPRLTIEISLLKIIEAGNITPVATLLNQFDTLLPQLSEYNQQQHDRTTTAPQLSPSRSSFATAEPPPAPTSSVREEKKPPQEEEQKKKIVEQAAGTTDTSEAAAATSLQDFHKKWEDFLKHLEKNAIWMAAAAEKTEKQQLVCDNSKTTLHLYFPEKEDAVLLNQRENLQKFTALAVDFFTREITVELHYPEKSDQTDKDSPQMRRKALAHNPLVQMTEDIFRGRVAAIRLADQRHSHKTRRRVDGS